MKTKNTKKWIKEHKVEIVTYTATGISIIGLGLIYNELSMVIDGKPLIQNLIGK